MASFDGRLTSEDAGKVRRGVVEVPLSAVSIARAAFALHRAIDRVSVFREATTATVHSSRKRRAPSWHAIIAVTDRKTARRKKNYFVENSVMFRHFALFCSYHYSAKIIGGNKTVISITHKHTHTTTNELKKQASSKCTDTHIHLL